MKLCYFYRLVQEFLRTMLRKACIFINLIERWRWAVPELFKFRCSIHFSFHVVFFDFAFHESNLVRGNLEFISWYEFVLMRFSILNKRCCCRRSSHDKQNCFDSSIRIKIFSEWTSRKEMYSSYLAVKKQTVLVSFCRHSNIPGIFLIDIKMPIGSWVLSKENWTNFLKFFPYWKRRHIERSQKKLLI